MFFDCLHRFFLLSPSSAITLFSLPRCLCSAARGLVEKQVCWLGNLIEDPNAVKVV